MLYSYDLRTFVWRLYHDKDRDNPLAEGVDCPMPQVGSICYHELLDAPLRVVDVVWHFRSGYPLEAHVILGSFENHG